MYLPKGLGSEDEHVLNVRAPTPTQSTTYLMCSIFVHRVSRDDERKAYGFKLFLVVTSRKLFNKIVRGSAQCTVQFTIVLYMVSKFHFLQMCQQITGCSTKKLLDHCRHWHLQYKSSIVRSLAVKQIKNAFTKGSAQSIRLRPPQEQ